MQDSHRAVPRLTRGEPTGSVPHWTDHKLLHQSWSPWVGVLAIAIVLSLNVFHFPFLWDDYELLGRVAQLKATDFLPDYSIIFYRPLSREVYFGVITSLLGESALASHMLNAAIFAAILILLMALMRRLAGDTAALVSGLIVACSASTPLMMGWISASQDLLCAMFIIASLYLLVKDKPIASSLALAGALLSKETAIAAIPAVGALAAALPRTKQLKIRFFVSALLVLIAWTAIHPWTRLLLSGAPSTGSEREYMGFHWGSVASEAIHGLAITLNIPFRSGGARWITGLVYSGLVASALIVFLCVSLKPGRENGDRPTTIPILVGALLVVGPTLLTAFLLGTWSTHYSFLPAIGASIAVAPWTARLPRIASIAVLLAFLWIGIGLRNAPFTAINPTEHNFTESAIALGKVEQGFKHLNANLPPKSNLYVSIQVRQSGGLYRHMLRLQAPRVWYREPTLWVLDPNRRRSSTGKEYLFWISPNLDVYEIDLGDLRPRGPTQQVDLGQYQKTIRGYAMGLAGAGDVDRAAYMLTYLPETSREVALFDRRTAVALLYARGRDRDADVLATKLPQFARPQAIEAVVALIAEPVIGLELDTAAMRAFAIDSTDADVVSAIMRILEERQYNVAAERFARRVQSLRPGDPESAAALERIRRARASARPILVPIPYDQPQE